MVKRQAIRLTALLAIAFLTGCYGPRLQRDQSYPADWPEILSLGPECSDLDGTYSNDGTVRTVLLTDILLRRQLSAEAKTVTLKVGKQKFGLVSYRTLQVDVNYGKGIRDNFSLGKVFGDVSSNCDKGAWIVCDAHDSTSDDPYARYIYLTRASDGSLIVKIRFIKYGWFLGLGYYKKAEFSEWARFNSVVD